MEDYFHKQQLQSSKIQMAEMNMQRLCEELAQQEAAKTATRHVDLALSDEFVKMLLLEDSLNLALIDFVSNLACSMQSVQTGGNSRQTSMSSSSSLSSLNLQSVMASTKKRIAGLDSSCLQQRRHLLTMTTSQQSGKEIFKLGLNLQDCWTCYLIEACEVVAQVAAEAQQNNVDKSSLSHLQSENQLLRGMIKQLEVM